MLVRRFHHVLGLVLLIGACRAATPSSPSGRYAIYVHGRIVEEAGRNPTSPEFGPYEYDAILDSLRAGGFMVLSDQRPAGANSEAWADRIAGQVDSLLRHGVAADSITVIGFSKGGWIAILASARLRNPGVSYVFLAACGEWSNDAPDLHVTGRILSLREASDTLGISCAPMLARRGAGPEPQERTLSLGLGHGTFFVPRQAWLDPTIAWARHDSTR